MKRIAVKSVRNIGKFCMTIFFTVVILGVSFAALATESWAIVTPGTQLNGGSGDWSSLELGLFRTVNKPQAFHVGTGTAPAQTIMATTDLLNSMSSWMNQEKCSDASNAFSSAAGLTLSSPGILISALTCTFAALIIAYMGVSNQVFKKAHFISCVLYLGACALDIAGMADFAAKMNSIKSLSCNGVDISFNWTIGWSFGMIILSCILCLACAVMMFLKQTKHKLVMEQTNTTTGEVERQETHLV